MKKTEYMEKHIGEYFDGVVSGITKWGVYVELEEYDRGTGTRCKYDRRSL